MKSQALDIYKKLSSTKEVE
jgi:hypothetical protein